MVAGELKIRIDWEQPSDTGFRSNDLQYINTYILEMDTQNSSLWGSSPYGPPGYCTEADSCNPDATSSLQVYSGTGYSHTMVGLTKGQRYFFRVVAVNDAGVGNTSITVSEQAIILPTKPTNAAVDIAGIGSIRMQYQIPVDTGIGQQLRPILNYRSVYHKTKQYP